MSDLLSWLRSTIESDLARARNEGPDWYSVEDLTDYDYCMDAGRAEYIVRHGPQDTIARCEAELALLDEHAIDDTGFGKYCRVCSEYSTKPGESSELEPAPAPCRTVLLLAASRRHSPGFNPEWVSE